jgi:microcystin-dependent protein
MSTPYLGEIRAVGFTFAPVGWATCNGQLLAISEYDALYALLGTTYGGDGQNTFGVPNLQSRVSPGAQG